MITWRRPGAGAADAGVVVVTCDECSEVVLVLLRDRARTDLCRDCASVEFLSLDTKRLN